MAVRLTVLVENRTVREDLAAEHGWAVLVETETSRGLFDTGKSDAVVENADALGIDLSTLEWIVLSHGHYDHAGGLPAVLARAPRARVALHPAAFGPHGAKESAGRLRHLGMPVDRDGLERLTRSIAWTEKPLRLARGVRATGPVPMDAAWETIEPRFVLLREDGTTPPDRFDDDQALVIEADEKLVVLLGCAHRGVLNHTVHAQRVGAEKPILAVVGGMHLGRADGARIRHTEDGLRLLGVERLYPAHCTGEAATKALAHAWGDRCRPCRAGDVLEF